MSLCEHASGTLPTLNVVITVDVRSAPLTRAPKGDNFMSIRPAVSAPTDKHGVRRRSVALLGSLLISTCALTLSGQTAQAAGGDPVSIFQKVKSTYLKAKTFKGTEVMTQSGVKDGKASSVVKTTEYRYKSPNLCYAL